MKLIRVLLMSIIALSSIVYVDAQERAGQSHRGSIFTPVEISLKKLDGAESKERFGKNLLNAEIQPIELVIQNDSPDLLLLRPSSINLPMEKAPQVVAAAKHEVFFTTLSTASVSALYFWPAMIPSLGLGLWLYWDNLTFEQRIKEHILSPDVALEIFPYERVSKTFFVRMSTSINTCSLYLFDVHDKSFIPHTAQF